MQSMKRVGKIAFGVAAVALTAGVALYFYAPHPPATPKQVRGLAQPEEHLQKVVASGNPPGLTIAVVKHGTLVYERAFGMADGPKAIAATPQTVYHWWSMTKIVTAIAIMQLQERGRLHLNDPVANHLPWFNAQYPSPASPRLTLRHLLNHSSGLPDTVPAIIGWVHYDDASRNQSELVRKLAPQFSKIQFEPGSQAVYSNFNYLLLGAVIEAVTGQSYERYVTENILKPLRMDQTGFVYTPQMAAHEAAGTLPVVHYYTPMLPALLNPFKLIRQADKGIFWLRRVYIDVTPSTGLIGPVADVARLLTAYLNHGEVDGAHILSPASIALMNDTGHVAGSGPNMSNYPGGEHGLGWYVIRDGGGHVRLQHDGGGPGFATTLRLYPQKGLGIVLMANGTDLDRDGLSDLLAGINWDAR
jgi:CubicO group peptidase (beta-lactamase class C family)